MKIVVDTNIVFSSMLNSAGSIGKILVNSGNHFEFYSCDFLKTELLKHRKKVMALTKLSSKDVNELQQIATRNITFINEALIPSNFLLDAEKLLVNIDLNDTVFVALAAHLKAKLWTGDKKLLNGLTNKNFKRIISTDQLTVQLNELERT